jgi:hypothetical protein
LAIRIGLLHITNLYHNFFPKFSICTLHLYFGCSRCPSICRVTMVTGISKNIWCKCSNINAIVTTGRFDQEGFLSLVEQVCSERIRESIVIGIYKPGKSMVLFSQVYQDAGYAHAEDSSFRHNFFVDVRYHIHGTLLPVIEGLVDCIISSKLPYQTPNCSPLLKRFGIRA